MKKYSLTATHNERSTTVPILARNKIGALTIASNEISKRYASDKRFEKGEIIVKSPENKVIMKIEEEKE